MLRWRPKAKRAVAVPVLGKGSIRELTEPAKSFGLVPESPKVLTTFLIYSTSSGAWQRGSAVADAVDATR